MGKTFLITHEADLRHWKISRPASGVVALLGWRTSPELETDDAVPDEVASVLARALTSVALVTFPSSQRLQLDPSDMVQIFTAKSLWQWMMDRTARTPSKTYLISTRRPATARLLFDDGIFPWSMQANLALISPPESVAPGLNRAQLFRIMELGPIDFRDLEGDRIGGVVAPGVDGAVAAVVSRDLAQEARILFALEGEARSAGFEWQTCSAGEFSDRLAAERLVRSRQ